MRATPVMPGPLDASGVGDPCRSDSDCHFLDVGCSGTRCGSRPRSERADQDCSAFTPTGSCLCMNGRCALKPGQPPGPDRSTPVPCVRGKCGLDEGAGRCVAGEMLRANELRLAEGPMCRCDEATGTCLFEWLERIPCSTDRDCWMDLEPRPHPIPRPRRLRQRRFRPCEEGEIGPVCVEGMCDVLPYPC